MIKKAWIIVIKSFHWMHDKNTLVILTPGFPASVADSTCLPMQQQFVKALKQQDPSLHIIVLSFQYPYLSHEYKWFDTTVISFNGKNKGGLARLMLRRRVYAALKHINRQYRITGLLSFWYNECALVGHTFARKYNLHHYCWILGQDARPGKSYPALLKLPGTSLIALSDSLSEEFERNYHTKPAFVIPAGIDSRLFTVTSTKKDIHLLAAGSLIPLKQFEIFIETVAALKKEIPGIQAVLIGDGPERKKLELLILKLNMRPNITLAGELSYPEVIKWMHRCRVMLHPSSYEGFSGVCLEALAAGMRVISFCKPMKADIVNWQIAQDKAQMINLALQVLQNPDNTFTSIIPYDIGSTAKKMLQLYNR